MSYEITEINEIDCLCGRGKIKQVSKSNEWNQTKVEVTIDCKDCIKSYDIISENFCPKPKHDYTLYYCKNKSTGEEIKLNL